MLHEKEGMLLKLSLEIGYHIYTFIKKILYSAFDSYSEEEPRR